jgi:hypothetical protein
MLIRHRKYELAVVCASKFNKLTLLPLGGSGGHPLRVSRHVERYINQRIFNAIVFILGIKNTVFDLDAFHVK